MATIVDGTLTSEIVHGLIINGEGRGAHHGKFRIGGSKDIEVVGILGGITNAECIMVLRIVSHVT